MQGSSNWKWQNVFITPKAILDDGQNNTFFKHIKDKLEYVDFTTNKKFNIGQDVISWKIENSKTPQKIKVIDKATRFVDSIYDVCEDDFIISKSILNKVSYKTNNKDKMKLFNTDKKYGIENKLLKLEKFENSVEVYCNTKKK